MRKTRLRLSRLPPPPSFVNSHIRPIALFKEVCCACEDKVTLAQLFSGVAGAVGATIVYPIDMGKARNFDSCEFC